MKIRSLDGKTPDIAEENIQKLRQIFPDVFTEDKIDFGKLQQVLGEYVEDSTERYNFTWNGKGRALRLSQTPSLGTLRPCKEESKDWDTTQNLYIEGDNLEVLKLLQKSYYGKIKMIYIDPPYNTGKDFVYKDDFHDSLENYKKITGQVDSEGNRVSTNKEASGRYHTDWLNMMYPRLRLARNLLTDDGVIFISIDDNEIENLKKICNEVFGEDNYIGTLIRKVMEGGKSDSKGLAIEQEYCHVYGKNAPHGLYKRESGLLEHYNKKDKYFPDRGYYYLKPLENGGLGYVPTLDYPIVGPDGIDIYPGDYYGDNGYRWVWSKEKFERAMNLDMIVFTQSQKDKNKYKVYYKIYEKVDTDGNLSIKELPYPSLYLDGYTNRQGVNDLKRIFEKERVFDYPKPVSFLSELIKMASKPNDIVLDFFSGSACAAQAVIQTNSEETIQRRFIMVQLPEATDEKSEAYKAGYKNICEIGKERIRRAGEKIKEKNKDKENIENLDIGFKVLKLDTSNIRKWQPDYDNLEQSLFDYVDNYMEGRTELDVVYEIMLKYGLELTYPVDEFTIAQKKVYSIGFGMLMICLDDEITTDVAKGILEKIKELAPESTRVVFKDNGLNSDSNKTNIKEILKCGGIEEFITL